MPAFLQVSAEIVRDVTRAPKAAWHNSSMGRDGLSKGIALFNQGQFFEAHEVLEDLWREAAPGEKQFVQGLTQLAVAFHHRSTGNLVGCRSVMARAVRNLSAHPDGLLELKTREILDAVVPCLRALEENQPLPSLPKLKIHHDCAQDS